MVRPGAIALPCVLYTVLIGGTAQAQSLHGIVVDDFERRPVAGAEVVLTGSGGAEAHAVTDSVGRFALNALRAGVYGVRVTHVSFVSFSGHSVALGTGEVVLIEVRLGRLAIPLEPLRVTARRTRLGLDGFDARRRSGFGQYLTREDIQTRNAARVTDLLRDLSGVSFQPLRDRRAGAIAVMSGGPGGRCRPSLWVDDVQVNQNDYSTIDQMLTPGALQAVEVYTTHAAAPPQYVTDLCGVILFWTRQGRAEGGARLSWKKLALGAGAAGLFIFLLAR